MHILEVSNSSGKKLQLKESRELPTNILAVKARKIYSQLGELGQEAFFESVPHRNAAN